MDHLKLLKVAKAIVERIQELPVGDEREFSRATMLPVLPYEEKDSAEEQFRRRMGMRKYFNQLSMNLVRIKNTKLALSKKNQEEVKVIQE